MTSPRSSHTQSSPSVDYSSWSKEELIRRVNELTSQPLPSRSRTRSHSPPRPKPAPKTFSFSKHPTRKIAIRFSYVGAEYNGLAFQNDRTPLPTVEGVLFQAFAKTRLIDGAAGFEGCGWERCGRTDRGVSAAGQVVSLWVRSALASGTVKDDVPDQGEDEVSSELDVPAGTSGTRGDPAPLQAQAPALPPKPPKELRYITLLNRVLPTSIRVHAFSPVDPAFSARFNCLWRHYKYFFSPANLDVAAMRAGAARLVGEHDFRNLCKLDPTKQITNFHRRVLRADISASDTGLCVLDLVGTAFLYHQVRHIMAILFLVGAGLEPPAVVSALLNADPEDPALPFSENEERPEMVSCKPEYQMADGLPLVLWDCGYDDADVAWRGEDGGEAEAAGRHAGDGAAPKINLILQLQSIHERAQIQTTLHRHFFASATRFLPPPPNPFPLPQPLISLKPGASVEFDGQSLNVPLGGGTFHRTSKYVRLLERKRLEKVEVTNERWKVTKGARREARRLLASEFAQDDDGDE